MGIPELTVKSHHPLDHGFVRLSLLKTMIKIRNSSHFSNYTE